MGQRPHATVVEVDQAHTQGQPVGQTVAGRRLQLVEQVLEGEGVEETGGLHEGQCRGKVWTSTFRTVEHIMAEKGIPIIHWMYEMPLEGLIIAVFCTQTAFSQIQKNTKPLLFIWL